mmetsp:Transcript_42598/g.47405  ORF Transcript_42598/g.47405 Transcript_42598/m.47405 type:complete len:82 (-) Transcript_42598:58-303(-)
MALPSLMKQAVVKSERTKVVLTSISALATSMQLHKYDNNNSNNNHNHTPSHKYCTHEEEGKHSDGLLLIQDVVPYTHHDVL